MEEKGGQAHPPGASYALSDRICSGVRFPALELPLNALEKYDHWVAAVRTKLGRQKSIAAHANSHHIVCRGDILAAQITFRYRDVYFLCLPITTDAPQSMRVIAYIPT